MAEWSNARDCKSCDVSLRGFESLRAHIKQIVVMRMHCNYLFYEGARIRKESRPKAGLNDRENQERRRARGDEIFRELVGRNIQSGGRTPPGAKKNTFLVLFYFFFLTAFFRTGDLKPITTSLFL